MYAVSQEYIEKLKSLSVKTRRITGMVGDVGFTEDDILMGSFNYAEQAVASSDIKLGGVFIGQLSLTFLKSFADRIPRGSWKGKEIRVNIGLKLDENTWEYVPIKSYFIEEANHSASGVDVKAYDVMTKFDKSMSIDTTSGKIYDYLTFACGRCGVQLGMTEEEVDALPNGNQILGLYPTNDIDTWRDLISWCAVTVGGFATINRSGALELRVWSDEPVLTLDRNDRFAGGTWSDFVTYYTGVSIVNIEKETTSYYGVPIGDTGLTMNLGSNPLLQYGTDELKAQQRRAVLTALQKFNYTPFKCSSLFDAALDLGDVIRFTGGLAGEDYSDSCVMRIDFNYSKGCTMQGYGKNPAVFGAKSKTDKNISGLISRTSENEYSTLTYVNITDFTLGENISTRVIDIKFASVKPKTVAMFHEINLDVELAEGSDVATCYVEYYLDSNLISYQPVATWNNSGKHILSLMYFLTTLAGAGSYNWEVKLRMSGATATVDIGDARALIQGQGLVEWTEWDGNIEFTGDKAIFIPAYTINAMSSQTITAETRHEMYENEMAGASEQIGAIPANGIEVVGIGDTIFIEFVDPDYVPRAGEGLYAGGGLTTGLL